jgi:hypothetical protein
MRESERHESPLVYGIANRNRTRTAFPELHKEKKDTFSLSTDPSAALKFIGQYSRVTIGTSINYHFVFAEHLNYL